MQYYILCLERDEKDDPEEREEGKTRYLFQIIERVFSWWVPKGGGAVTRNEAYTREERERNETETKGIERKRIEGGFSRPNAL